MIGEIFKRLLANLNYIHEKKQKLKQYVLRQNLIRNIKLPDTSEFNHVRIPVFVIISIFMYSYHHSKRHASNDWIISLQRNAICFYRFCVARNTIAIWLYLLELRYAVFNHLYKWYRLQLLTHHNHHLCFMLNGYFEAIFQAMDRHSWFSQMHV